MASKDHFLSQVPDYQPWYKKWLNKIRSGKKNEAPDTAGPHPPARQAAHQNARMQQLENDQNFWYWHHHHYLNEPQPSPSSQRLPALSSPEPNQSFLKNSDQSGFVETAGIQQPNVSDCNIVPDSRVVTPPQDLFMENTGRDVYCVPSTGDCQATEMYHYADATPDFDSDSYCSDPFASAD